MVYLFALLAFATSVWAGVSLLGILYPFRPFSTRRRALFSFLGSFAFFIGAGILIGVSPDPTVEPTTNLADLQSDATGTLEQAPKESSLTASPDQSPIEVSESTNGLSATCDDTRIQNDVVGVKSEYELRVGPSKDSDRIKNEKASASLGELHYHQVDTSTTVKIVCTHEGWSKVSIIAPEWLNFVTGWVPNSALRTIAYTEDGARVYVESDFNWDDDTSKHKKQIVAVVNKIARQHENCPDPGSVFKSVERSEPGAPVFFVMCGTGMDVFNVWFRPEDAENGKVFDAVRPISESDAADACEVAAKTATAHPSTVDFSRFLNLSYVTYINGRARLTSTFTAKNSFNLELEFKISCLFEGNEMVENSIDEVR